MAQIFVGRVYGGSPYPSAEINYEYTRDGANMKYHFWGRVYLESSGGWYYNNLRLKLYLNGSDIYTKDCKSSSKGWSIDFDSGWHTVSNKTSGTTPFYFTVKDTQNTSWCNYTSETYQLDVAPAYTSITGFSVGALNETTVRFNWSAAHTVDYVWYSTNNGANWGGVDVADGTSGSFDIGGLAANTGYNFKIRVRRKDSQLTTDSSAYYAATYNWPYITSAPDFIIGNALTIGLYNPLGRNFTLYGIGAGDNTIFNGTGNGTSLTGFNDPGSVSDQYASIPTLKSSTYKVRLIVSDVGRDTTVNGGSYSITQNDFEKPLFDSSYIINITNSLYTDIAGNNKFIKNHNKLSGVIKPMNTQKSATPDYYSISASGLSTITKSYSSSNQAFELGNMNTNTFNVTAFDKRGMSRTATVNIPLVDYNNPGVSNSTIIRQDGIGTKAIISFVGNYTNWSDLLQPNTIKSIRYRYKLSKENNYLDWKELPENAELSCSNGIWSLYCILEDDFVNTSQYDLQLEISDLLETIVTGTYTISTANALIWRDLLNKRLGIGIKPDYTLDVNGDLKLHKTSWTYNDAALIGSKQASTHTIEEIVEELRYTNGQMGSFSLDSTYTRNNITIPAIWYNYIYIPHRYGGNSGKVNTPDTINQDNHNYGTLLLFGMVESRPQYTIRINNGVIVELRSNGLDSYPVGSIYISGSPTSPASLFGGSWTQIKNRFLFATNSTSGNKGKDAQSSHTGVNVTGTAINQNQMPSHSHSFTTQAAGAHQHNIYLNGDPSFQFVGNPGWTGSITPANAAKLNCGSGSFNGYPMQAGYAGCGDGQHQHIGGTDYTGGSQAHNHSISYIEVYVWQRIG